MVRQAVNSSDLKSVGYDPHNLILEIEFHNGGIYQYSSVPKNIFSGLMAASSLGKYFHQFIKNKFSYSKV